MSCNFATWFHEKYTWSAFIQNAIHFEFNMSFCGTQCNNSDNKKKKKKKKERSERSKRSEEANGRWKKNARKKSNKDANVQSFK